MPEMKDFYCSLMAIFFVATPRTQHVVSAGTYQVAESVQHCTWMSEQQDSLIMLQDCMIHRQSV